uniref:Uncharacterized protein n=1 Tax=Vannella robusta TaxID=1487602 RepID=A0A7S4M7T4_9EUKA|mmetsp:Transcript_13851/g.17427  ORF Transcript_13851/g.17427 Transcript_13851/m.17427 type:complete len:101 (+) Transcript_13851:30-332(+)
MPKFFKKIKKQEDCTSPNQTVTMHKPAPMSRKVTIPFCKCDEDDVDPVEDDCDANKGCGKPLFYCGECFKLIKQKEGEQCSCAFTKRKLGNCKKGEYGMI